MSLAALATAISGSVNIIEAAVASAAATRRSGKGSGAATALSATPHEVLEAVDIIINACSELVSKVQDSTAFIAKHALAFNVSAALRVAVEGNVPEILRPHGSKGLQVDEIAHQADVNPQRLERLLRLLVSHHIFTSPLPGYFANNRHSAALDSGKPAESLVQSRELNPEKYDGPNELPSLVSHSTDEMFKSASHLTECILEPSTSRAFFGDQTPFSHAFETGMDYRSFLQLSFDQETRLRRFMHSTDCLATIGNSDSGLKGFNWSSLGNGLVIDVGGGIGHVALHLAKSYPNLRIVLQDRPEVIVQAHKFWGARMPQAVKSGRVTLEAHNVLDEEKRRGASAFFVRFVVREWNDTHALKILSNLHRAAQGGTKLILVERIVTDHSLQDPLPTTPTSPQSPLLGGVTTLPAKTPPLGSVIATDSRRKNVFKYAQISQGAQLSFKGGLDQTGRPLHNLLDAQLMLYSHGRERSLQELGSLLDQARWTVKTVTRAGTSSLVQIICQPKHSARSQEVEDSDEEAEEEENQQGGVQVGTRMEEEVSGDEVIGLVDRGGGGEQMDEEMKQG